MSSAGSRWGGDKFRDQMRAFLNSYEALPSMGEDAPWGADEVGAASLLGRQGDDDGGGEGQGNGLGEGGPAGQGRALEGEDAEEAPEEALDGAAFGQFGSGPGRGEAGAVFGALGVKRDDGDRPQGGVDPSDQRQAPVSGVQADDAGAQGVERDGGAQQREREGGIMAIGGGQAEEEGQARGPTEQGVQAVAAQEARGVMGRGVA